MSTDPVEGTINNLEDAWKINFEDLVFEKEIGRGAFGAVFRGSYFGTEVAIKKVFDLEDDPDAMIYLEREVNVLKGMRHPNIVQFIGICDDKEAGLHIVTEYVSGGDLRQFLKKEEVAMGWKLRIKIAMDIAAAMTYVHSRNIIHRDLKSKNLLVDDSWRVKVCDFGLARTNANRPMTLCGTDDWMAPEVILGMQYNQKADVFSFGIVLCEIITRKKISLELQRSPMDAFGMDVGKFKQLIPEDCPLDFAVLALECCAYDPEDRPGFKDIIAKLKAILTGLPEEIPQARPSTSGSSRGATPVASGSGAPASSTSAPAPAAQTTSQPAKPNPTNSTPAPSTSTANNNANNKPKGPTSSPSSTPQRSTQPSGVLSQPATKQPVASNPSPSRGAGSPSQTRPAGGAGAGVSRPSTNTSNSPSSPSRSGTSPFGVTLKSVSGNQFGKK